MRLEMQYGATNVADCVTWVASHRQSASVSRIFTQKDENQAAMQKEKNNKYRRS